MKKRDDQEIDSALRKLKSLWQQKREFSLSKLILLGFHLPGNAISHFPEDEDLISTIARYHGLKPL